MQGSTTTQLPTVALSVRDHDKPLEVRLDGGAGRGLVLDVCDTVTASRDAITVSAHVGGRSPRGSLASLWGGVWWATGQTVLVLLLWFVTALVGALGGVMVSDLLVGSMGASWAREAVALMVGLALASFPPFAFMRKLMRDFIDGSRQQIRAEPAPRRVVTMVEEVLRVIRGAIGPYRLVAGGERGPGEGAAAEVDVEVDDGVVEVRVGGLNAEPISVRVARGEGSQERWLDQNQRPMPPVEIAREVGAALSRRLLARSEAEGVRPASARLVKGAPAPVALDDARGVIVVPALERPSRSSAPVAQRLRLQRQRVLGARLGLVVVPVIVAALAVFHPGALWIASAFGVAASGLFLWTAWALGPYARELKARVEAERGAPARARVLALRGGRLAWEDAEEEEEGVVLARPFRLEVWRAHRVAVVEVRQGDQRVRFGVLAAPDDAADWEALPRLDVDVEVVDGARLGPLWARLVAHAQLHGERVGWGFVVAEGGELAGRARQGAEVASGAEVSVSRRG